MKEVIINAEGCIVGRLSSIVAKRLLNGEKINIVNAEKAIISGNESAIFQYYKEKTDRGDEYLGPFYPKRPDQILKRTIRGMLPYKKQRGEEAFKRLKVFISVPEKFKNKKMEVIEKAKSNFKYKYSTLGDISIRLGAKKTW